MKSRKSTKVNKLKYYHNYKWCAETLEFVRYDGNYAVFKNHFRKCFFALPISEAQTLEEIK